MIGSRYRRVIIGKVNLSLAVLGIGILLFDLAVCRTSGQTNQIPSGSPDENLSVLSGAEATKREQNFEAEFGSYVKAPRNLTLQVLVFELSKPLTNSVTPLLVWGGDPFDKYSDEENFEFLSAALVFGGRDGKLEPSQGAPYLRKLFVIAELLERGEESLVMDYLVKRASHPVSDVMDILLSGSGRGLGRKLKSFQTPEDRAKWRQLANATNPCMRMIGLMHSRYWAEPAEALPLCRSALKEKYPYARYLALEQLQEKPLPGGKQILEEFVMRKIDPKLPPEALEREQKLTDKAKEALEAFAKESSLRKKQF